jgi:hypothetical protein
MGQTEQHPQNRTVRTGQEEQDCRDMTERARKRKGSLDRTGSKKQQEKNKQKITARLGQSAWDSKPGQAERDRQNGAGNTGLHVYLRLLFYYSDI